MIMNKLVKCMKYRQIEHTADLGLQVFGKSLPELFRNAHLGFYAVTLGDPQNLTNLPQADSLNESLTFNEASLEDLLVAFLSELNFFLQVKQQVLYPLLNLEIQQTTDYVKLKTEGQKRQLNEYLLNQMTEIKAVTYHNLQIIKQNGVYSATIIFDI